ncbi:MAG TPA: SurA N-terminal domain-containing protein, partial [Gemmatimonadales bacterium]|nr:SurA N-terminal domain-containing protein [Gemmatimonadales bacterium]
MRAIVKPVFYVLAISFVGWLVFGQVQDILGGGKDVVLKIDGDVVRAQQFQLQYQAALEQYRRQAGGGRLTREDEQEVQNQVADQFIRDRLLERAYRQLGITVSDEEIIQSARSAPPPQLLRQVLQEATFQTNGQFDITKWQRYLSSAGPEVAAQIEQLYREYLPQRKLEEYLTADLYISDAKLWRVWRDQHESVTVALVGVRPEDIPDSLAPVSAAELARYYEQHAADYKRPGAAWLSFVAVPRVPDRADSVAALARVRGLRAEIVGGKAKFEDVAKRESADSGTATRGGDLGWIKRSQPGFDPKFLAALRSLGVGVVSEPVLSAFGYHLIKIDAAKGDSVHVRHLLVRVALQGKRLDAVDARTDTLDRIAADQTDGARLDSAARVLHLAVARAPRLVRGDRLVLPTGPVPDASVWAFEARAGETSPVIDAPGASYVFRLDSLEVGGVPPLAAVRGRVLRDARHEQQRVVARARSAEMARALARAADLLAAA